MQNLITFSYLISAILFILTLYFLSSPKTSRKGNYLGIIGMIIAISATLFLVKKNFVFILLAIAIGAAIGILIAQKVKMTAMPQLVAAFHSLVGLAAVLIATCAVFAPESFGILDSATGKIKLISLIETSLGSAIGAITFTGSIVAFLKLNGNMKSNFKFFKNPKLVANFSLIASIAMIVGFIITGRVEIFLALTLFAFILGFILIAPIGGADMPVVVSMLNSYSGFAAVGIGFTLNNILLIIAGALIGASGAILSYIMCKAMNRSLISVIFKPFSESSVAASGEQKEQRPIKQANAEDAAQIIKSAESVIIVPGYGMAVANAQHAVSELMNVLEEKEISVKFAIHPVAGRMPGHMNVLLAEANIDYEKVFELEEINSEFQATDVAIVIGANDVTNPAAKTDKASPIYGMPILDVEKAKTIFFVKRSMGAGYAGVENELFFKDNTFMIFGDAKKVSEEIVKNL